MKIQCGTITYRGEVIEFCGEGESFLAVAIRSLLHIVSTRC